MSTKCFIGKINSNGSVKSIYCHWDGYLAYAGRTLLENYKTPDKVDALLNLGDLSFLGDEPISDPKQWDLSFEDDNYKGCRSYKDRGDADCDAQNFKSVVGFVHQMNNTYVDYAYLYVDGEWYWSTCKAPDKFELLTDEVIKNNGVLA